MPDPRADLFLSLWAKHAPIPFAWPHNERFNCWFSMAIPAVFARLKNLELENQQRNEDVQQLQRERDMIKAQVERLRALAHSVLSYEELDSTPIAPAPVPTPSPTNKVGAMLGDLSSTRAPGPAQRRRTSPPRRGQRRAVPGDDCVARR